jgi:hypothetical protein
VVEFLKYGYVGNFADPEILLAIGGGYLVAILVVNLDFLRARRFLRKGGYLDSIRYDTQPLTNCSNAFALHPSRAMLWYIKHLNPAGGAMLAAQVKQGRKEKRKRRLHYLPFALLLAAVLYLLPRYRDNYYLLPQLVTRLLPYLSAQQILLIEHLITLVVLMIYAGKYPIDVMDSVIELLIVFVGLFALMLYANDLGDLWQHMIINAVVVYGSMYLGLLIRGRKREKGQG